jgi:hypothetical protein
LAQLQLYSGTVNRIINVYVVNSSTGAGLTGLTSSTAGLTAYFFTNAAGSSTAISLTTMTLGTWASGGFVEVDATHMPGLYALGLPNAIFANMEATIIMKGATNMTETVVEIEITATNNQDAIRGGLTALPAGPMMFKKNQAFNNFDVLMVSNVDHVTPLTGLSVTSQVRIDGAGFVPTTNSTAEVSNGIYSLNLAQADTNGNKLTLVFSAANADSRYVEIITQP